jgi:hypothetical protein
MNASSQRKWYWRPDYLGFSVACAGAWAVVWILLVSLASTKTVHSVTYVFLGWLRSVHCQLTSGDPAVIYLSK